MRCSLTLNKEYGLNITLLLGSYNTAFRIFKDTTLASTTGLRNLIIGAGSHRLLFLDYDEILWEALLEELRYFKNKYELSDIYILRSSQKPNSYHAICLDYLKPREWKTILEESSCDENYKKMPMLMDGKCHVLRVSKKGSSEAPKLKAILKSPYNKRKKSKAHALWLHHQHGIKITKLTNLDKNTKLCYINYKTMSYITEDEKKKN